jgi:hypothetical protein
VALPQPTTDDFGTVRIAHQLSLRDLSMLHAEFLTNPDADA